MKTNLIASRSSKLVFLLGMLIFIFNSCNENKEELIVESPISSSLKGFQSLINQPNMRYSTSEQNTIQSSDKKDKFRRVIPSWIKAKLRRVGDKDLVVVPMFAPGYLFVGDDGSEKIPLTKACTLLAYKSDGEWIYEIVTKINEADGLTKRVIISDWHGNFKRGYRYLIDGSIKAIAEKKPSKGKTFTTSSACFVTTYYTCVSVTIEGQFSSYCGPDGSSITCNVEFADWVEPLPKEHYLQLGGGGGDEMTVEELTQAETDYSANLNKATIYGYYNNIEIGDSFGGEVTGLSFVAQVYENGSRTQNIPVTLGTVCFDIPNYSFLGYSVNSATASTAFVLAYNSALDEVMTLIQINPLIRNSVSIRAMMLDLVLLNLQAYRLGSTASSGPCANSYPSTPANYCRNR